MVSRNQFVLQTETKKKSKKQKRNFPQVSGQLVLNSSCLQCSLEQLRAAAVRKVTQWYTCMQAHTPKCMQTQTHKQACTRILYVIYKYSSSFLPPSIIHAMLLLQTEMTRVFNQTTATINTSKVRR